MIATNWTLEAIAIPEETHTMKAQIYVNRHIMAANKKASKETGNVVDEPAIAIRTYLGSVYAREVELLKGGKLIQDAENARCSGATIWMEVENLDDLLIDGQKAERSMFVKLSRGEKWA